MSSRSRLWICEAFLDTGGVTYRVASGSGWSAVGGQPVHHSGRFRVALDTELSVDVFIAVSNAALSCGQRLVDAGMEIDRVEALPMG